ncbi:MAG TPA: ABC transporter permease [Amycolatopsis sp.]|nr:ABC transporter permease [Amycolatopsis sp.]
MTELLTIIAAGLAAASLYVTFGVGLAFVYRVTGVLNFAHGAVASVSGYLAFTLIEHNLPYPVAALTAIVAAAAISALIYLLLIIHLPSRSAEAIGILTLGVAIVLQGVLQGIYGGEPRTLRPPVRSSALFEIGDYGVNASTLVNVGVAVLVVLGLGLMLHRTKFGLGVRAASEGGVTASMFGISPVVVNTSVWAIGGALGGVTALLVTPVNQLSPGFMTFYLLVAFVAVVLGGFESITGIVIGAVVFGIVQSLVATYLTTKLTSTVSFVVIVLVLFFLPKGLLGRLLPHVPEPVLPRFTRFAITAPRALARRLSAMTPARRSPLRSSPAVLVLPLVIAGIVVLLAPALSSTGQLLVATIACYFIATLGTDVIYGYSGQLSLGQAGFMLAGAYISAIVQKSYGVPYLAALVISAIACAVIGLVFGWPASRLSGVYLAVTTLAFVLAVPELASFFTSVTGGDNGIVSKVPSWLAGSSHRNQHLLTFTVLVAGVLALPVIQLCRSRPGRQWRALRANETAAAANGVAVGRQKVLAFVLGAALSGLGGAMVASLTGYLSPESFSLWDSIYLVVAVVIGGRASSLGALIGALLVVGLPYLTSGSASLSGIALGLALILVLLLWPRGVRGLVVTPLLWLLDVTTGRRPPPAPVPAGHEEPVPATRRGVS